MLEKLAVAEAAVMNVKMMKILCLLFLQRMRIKIKLGAHKKLSPVYVIRAIAHFRRLSKLLSIFFLVKYDTYALRSYNYNTGGAL